MGMLGSRDEILIRSGIKQMKLNLILVLGIAIMILLIVIKGSQYVMMQFFALNFDLMETILLPMAVLGSFIVGYFIANHAGRQKEPEESEE